MPITTSVPPQQRKRMIAVGGICNTTIYRVDHVPALPAKLLPTEMRQLVDGMAASAACAFVKLGGDAEIWALVGDDDQGVTMRSELGYFWFDKGTIRHVKAPVVTVVDTLSAGDVFHGAFALALLEGKSIEDCARFACVAASLKCTRFGGRLGCPARAEVELMLSESY